MAVVPKLVVFDLDGTLIEFHHDYLLDEAERILPEIHPRSISREELFENFSDFDFFRFVEEAIREDFIKQFWSAFDWRAFPPPQPFSFTMAVLTEIESHGIQCAVATARLDPLNELWSALQPTGLLPFITKIVTRAGEHIDWTDKSGQIAELAAHFQVTPAEMLLVGDTPSDIASAKAAGIGTTVAVCSGGVKEHILQAAGPDFLIADISHLPSILFPSDD